MSKRFVAHPTLLAEFCKFHDEARICANALALLAKRLQFRSKIDRRQRLSATIQMSCG